MHLDLLSSPLDHSSPEHLHEIPDPGEVATSLGMLPCHWVCLHGNWRSDCSVGSFNLASMAKHRSEEVAGWPSVQAVLASWGP